MRFQTAALLLLAALAPSRAGAEPEPLRVVVHGKVNAIALGARISDELAKQVELVETCAGSCLEIEIVSGKATIAFVSEGVARRERTVELGADRSQWPLVITLLAGNLVRDEADDVLAGLPAPRVLGPDEAAEEAPPDEASPGPVLEPTPVVDVAVDVDVNAGAAPRFVLPQPESAVVVDRYVAPRERDFRLFSLGFVPGVSTDFANTRVQHLLSLDALVGVSAGSDLVSIAGIADVERGDVFGVQLAGIAATAHDVSGFQVAGITSVAHGVRGFQIGGIATLATRSVHGLQLAGIAVAADRVEAGGQIAGIAAYAHRQADVQVGGIAAVSRGSASMQVAGIAAYARRSASIQVGGIAAATEGDANLQVAGIASVANAASFQIGGIASVARRGNIQVAGVVNVADELRGVQIAPINIARDVEGVQIGVLNYGGSRDGFSFGLINIVPGGRADIEATIDSERLGTVLFRHGGRRWHNVYGVGGHAVDEPSGATRTDDVWMYGLGFGPSWQRAHSVIDLELMGWQVNHGARHSDDLSLLSQLRLSVAYGRTFQVVAGGALNAYISSDRESPLFLERQKPGMEMDPGVNVKVWPSAFVGLRM